ncbi:chondroitin sulfate synthase 2 [Plodia interpunctella]|uniref:chondroitin sulfate synthase 2 n=1 Tax=Plodia interpunctella TaxID=58824 RepID=UPI0023684416|nr:chondroitin sulfate synthase 2 [Plodia interpunctella]
MLSRYVVAQVKHNSYFLLGLVLGLWVALVAVPLEEDVVECVGTASGVSTEVDEFEPHREDRPLGAAGPAAGRVVQRPRYYTTELGMRGPLLSGVLSSEEALAARGAALNQTAARLQPSLRFFIAANSLSPSRARANVVGFTDTREMLKPFHALKYLADNYLEEYDFFFLVSDATFVNARRLTDLVSKLSVSQDVYMGTIAEDDSHYCTLEGGILLSNSVLRAVHGELDWCVRNSYSPHHHENLGRCVLHAAHQRCSAALQGERYSALKLADEAAAGLTPALADAVTAYPVTQPEQLYQLHAYVSRLYLERDQSEVLQLRGYLWRNAARHPPGLRNATWPGGLRTDAGRAPRPPDNRFDHLRWTTFNLTHAFMPDENRAVGVLSGAYKEALDLVVDASCAWAKRRWGREGAGADGGGSGNQVDLEEGAWRWEPPYGLRYRLLLRETDDKQRSRLRYLEAIRVLGSARLVPVPYVTESARITLVLTVAGETWRKSALSFLRRYETICLGKDKNTVLIVALVSWEEETEDDSTTEPIRSAIAALQQKHAGVKLELVTSRVARARGASEAAAGARAARGALEAALSRVSRDALVLVLVPNVEFNEEFLNRVRMNTIMGEQWFLPVGFSRFSQYDHPRFVDAKGNKPQVNTGRFQLHADPVMSFYRKDYDSAAAESIDRGESEWAGIDEVLIASSLRCVRAPEPALVLPPRAAPCRARAADTTQCLRATRDENFVSLALGARHELARLLLETEADV